MRKGTGIAGATLLFAPEAEAPDLLLAMQFLLDDLRAEGRRVGGLKLTATTLRLRAEPYEMVLTLAEGPLPSAAMNGLLRPDVGDSPDFPRVRLARTLRVHSHAMGFLVRRRGAPLADLDDAARQLVREGRLCLMPVIEAAPPSLLIWQPGGLVLSTDEFRRADPMLLLRPGDAGRPLSVTPPERLGLARPGSGSETTLPTPFRAAPGTPASRAEREDRRSLGRLFGKTPDHPPALPRLDRSSDRLADAMRHGDDPPAPRPGRLGGLLPRFS